MKIRPQAWITVVLFIAAAVGQTAGQTVASAGTFPGANGKIAFAGEGHIEVINADGTGRATLGAASPASSVNEPAWNATGTKLVFRKGGSSLYTMNADGSNVKLLVTMPSFVGNPTWSPDGSVIAFDGFIGRSESRIYTVPAAGGTATELVALDALDPSYSPDGTKIAYEDGFENSDIGVMNADGSGAANITSAPSSGNNADFDPTWHPDAMTGPSAVRKIAFTRAKQIWTMNTDGSGATLLGDPSQLGSHPTWSPDGTKLAFSDGDDLWVYRANGSGEYKTNTPDIDEKEPDWGVAPTVYGRSVSLALTRHLRATGKITVVRGVNEDCMANVPVTITRNGKAVAKIRTTNAGAYNVKLKDRPGRYIAVAPKLLPAAGGICSKAKSPVRGHRH